MKIYRWQGLAVFAVLFLLIWAFSSFYLDGLIKRGLQEEGSKIIQSQIEVDSVATSLMSQSGGLQRLAIANADNLMQNLVEIDSISFNVDAGKAVVKKVVIDEMSVAGIRLNQKRQTPAKAYKSPGEDKANAGEGAEEESGGLLGLGKIMSPKSPEEILKSEKLETLEAMENTKKQMQALKDKWQKKLETDLSPKVLEETRAKIEALQKQTKNPSDITGTAAAIQDITKIQETIQGNLNQIKSLKKEMQEDSKRLKTLVADLKKLPQKDFERLRKKYSFDMKGGSNILASLLGGQVKEKIDLFWKYYERVSPYLNKGGAPQPVEEEEKYIRGKGVFVPFRERNPFPDFLIRHAGLSMELWDTRIAGDLKDFSDNQRAYGKPASIHFSSDQDDRFENFDLHIKLDRTREVADDGIDFKVKSLKLDNMEAGKGAKIRTGLADLESSFKIVDEKNMSGAIQADLRGLALNIPDQPDNELFRIVADTLSSTETFFIKIAVEGSREKYDVNIDSDLDKIISGALKGAVAGKIQDFEKSLKRSIFSATGGPLSGMSDSLGEFLKLDELLGENASAWTGLLDKAKEGATPAPLKDKLPLPGGLEGLKLPF